MLSDDDIDVIAQRLCGKNAETLKNAVDWSEADEQAKRIYRNSVRKFEDAMAQAGYEIVEKMVHQGVAQG